MNTNERTYKSVTISFFLAAILSIFFNYFALFFAWKIDTVFTFSKQLSFLYYSFVLITLSFLFLKSSSSFFWFILFKTVGFSFLIITLLVGCGGMWFYLFSKNIALLANTLILIVVILTLLLRLRKAMKYDIQDRITQYDIIDKNQGVFVFNTGQRKIEKLLEDIRIHNTSKTYSIVYSFFISIASVLGFLLLGFSISLDRLGLDLVASLVINLIFYFIFILFALSNDVVSNFILNHSLLLFINKQEKYIGIT